MCYKLIKHLLHVISFTCALPLFHSGFAVDVPELGTSRHSLGAGYDTRARIFRESCIVPQFAYGGQQWSSIDLENALSHEELHSKLAAQFKASVNFFIASAEAAFKIAGLTDVSDLSRTFVYAHEVVGKEAIVTDYEISSTGQRAIDRQDPEYSRLLCGDEFVERIRLGGSLYLRVRFDFYDKQIKNEWEARITAKIGPFRKSLTRRGGNSFIDSHSSVTFDAVQIGGNPAVLKGLMANVKTLTCRLDNLEACEEIVHTLADYATSETGFRAQLANLAYDPTNPSASSILAYETKPYSQLGIAGLSVTNDDPYYSMARTILASLVEKAGRYENDWHQVKASAESPMTPSREQSRLTLLAERIWNNRSTVLSVRDICLRSSKACVSSAEQTLAQSVQAYTSDEMQVILSLADLCLQAMQHPVSSVDKEFYSLLMRAADVDDCLALDGKAHTVTSLVLDGFKHPPLGPLAYFGNLRRLSLARTDLSWLGDFRGLRGLTELNVRGNRVSDFGFVRLLSRLETFDAALNQVADYSPLARHPRLANVILFGNTGNPDVLASLPSLKKWLVTIDEGCQEERRILLAEGLISSDEFQYYDTINAAPVYANAGKRRSGITMWGTCSFASENF